MAQNLKVQGPAAIIVTIGDAVATSVDMATIGGTIRALSDGVLVGGGQSVGTVFTVTA